MHHQRFLADCIKNNGIAFFDVRRSLSPVCSISKTCSI